MFSNYVRNRHKVGGFFSQFYEIKYVNDFDQCLNNINLLIWSKSLLWMSLHPSFLSLFRNLKRYHTPGNKPKPMNIPVQLHATL